MSTPPSWEPAPPNEPHGTPGYSAPPPPPSQPATFEPATFEPAAFETAAPGGYQPGGPYQQPSYEGAPQPGSYQQPGTHQQQPGYEGAPQPGSYQQPGTHQQQPGYAGVPQPESYQQPGTYQQQPGYPGAPQPYPSEPAAYSQAPAPAQPAPYASPGGYDAAPPLVGSRVPASSWSSPPPPTWTTPAPSKRAKWPWFLAGGAVALVGLVVVAGFFLFNTLTADQNGNYDAEPIAVGDVPEHGDYVIISDNGKVAFDGMDEWYDASAIPGIGDIAGGFPDGATMMGTYFTSDPTVSMVDIPALVLVVEGADPGQVASVDIAQTHDEIVKGAMQGAGDLGDPTWQNGPTSVTTAHGLEGFKTEAGFTLEGVDVVVDWYTFARKERVVMIQIASYDGSPAVEPAELITDTLRIDP